MSDLESWEGAENKPLERRLDPLKNRPLDISKEDWKSHLKAVRVITAGIHRVLPVGVSPEELSDLVSEAQLWLLGHPEEGFPFNAGRRVASAWRRKNFEGEYRTQSLSDLAWFDGKRNDEVLNHNLEENKLQSEAECAPSDAQIRALLVCKRAAPEDCALVVNYLTRKESPSNRFTRAESAAYERAVRRLRKSAK